jgi:hemolysin activation/secretion protein
MDCNGQTVSQFACTRYQAKPDYFYLRGGVERTHNLPLGMALYAKVDGQVAGGPLISKEQFTAGGADSVRGYLEAEQAGDDGVHGTLEWRGPQWAAKGGKLNDLRLLAFMDGAALRVREALPGQTARFTLSGAGIGLRVQAWDDLSLAADVAWPFKDTAYTSAGHARLGFRTTVAF